MKKLFAAGCCIIAFQSFSQVACANDSHDQFNGRRVLIKALAVMMNTDAYRKAPPKHIILPNLESPRI